MKLSYVFLFVGLIASAQCAAKQDKTEDESNKTESSRRGRFFFLGNLLSGPAALASAGANSVGKSFLSLSQTLGGVQSTNTVSRPPSVVYVARQQRQCPLPLFTSGCPLGHVCSTGGSGGTRCVPQSADGGPCTTGFQCVSGVCRDHVCGRREECSVTGVGRSNCPLGQQCVLTSRGYRCQLGSDRCPRPFSSLGCNRNQYCTSSSTGNFCTEKLPVDARCTDPIECLSGTCRNNRCKQDACPMVDTSIDCMPTQYCSPGERGNMCVAKKEARARCSASQQCLSNVCERGVCVEDECPNPYMSDRCLPSQYCSPAPRGNMCREKRDTNARCQRDIECMSNTCFNQRCVTNQCTTPFSTDGCSLMTQYCTTTINGNQCVTRLSAGQTCLVNTQCMSNNCLGGTCSATTTGQRPIGSSCTSPTECASSFCVLGSCAANRISLGGMCLTSTDCQSLACSNMQCVTAGTITTTGTTTGTTTLPNTSGLGIGAACTLNTQCASLRCLNMVCTTALLPVGEMCTANTECLSNLCNANMCALGTVAMGDPCTNNFQCATGLCTDALLCA